MSKNLKIMFVFILLSCASIGFAVYPPAVVIDSPNVGQSFSTNQEIEFIGSAIDPDGEKILPKDISWTSDLDGFLFNGLKGNKTLKIGNHIITMTVTDSEKKSTSKCTFIRIKPVMTEAVKNEPNVPVTKPVENNSNNNKKETKVVNVKQETKKPFLKGLCYGSSRDNQDPTKGIVASMEEINQDLIFISKATGAIRTYDSRNCEEIAKICCKYNIKCSIGAWLGKDSLDNKKEINNIIKLSNSGFACVDSFIIGNESMLRRDLNEQELITFVREVKEKVKIPVTCAEIWAVWRDSPSLASEVDYILVHIHPFWENVPIEKAAGYVLTIYKDLKSLYPNKQIVIGETGWPSQGSANGNSVPSPENQARFFKEFTELAEKEKIEYYYFSCFDEKWKANHEGEIGAYWGIFNSNGSVKPLLNEFLPKEIEGGIERLPGKIEKVKANFPLYVYVEASEKCAFEPSGWMGDIDCINIVRDCTESPSAGKTCIRIEYTRRGIFSQGWSGVYWQYPINNWGDSPGYDLTGAKMLTFLARGKNGGEKSEFKCGGIKDGKNSDTFGPITTGVVTLSKEWKKYELSLANQKLSNVIGGFCWVTNYQQNPNGAVIYLDDIVFE